MKIVTAYFPIGTMCRVLIAVCQASSYSIAVGSAGETSAMDAQLCIPMKAKCVYSARLVGQAGIGSLPGYHRALYSA